MTIRSTCNNIIRNQTITTEIDATRGDTIVIAIQSVLPVGATVRAQLRETADSELFYVLEIDEQNVIISSEISSQITGPYVLDVEVTLDGIVTTVQRTTVNFIADVTRIYGTEAPSAVSDFERGRIFGTEFWVRNPDGSLTLLVESAQTFTDWLADMFTWGEKISYVDAGLLHQESLTNDYTYKCVQEGVAETTAGAEDGTAIWKKTPMFQSIKQ